MSRYKLIYFVPESHLEETKGAIFAAGGGALGDYDHCAWQVLGVGQFRPMNGAQPFLGHHGIVERVAEYRVEIMVEGLYVSAAIQALKDAHPYEEPAFELVALVDPEALSAV